MLRREGLYSSHLGKWRRQAKSGDLEQKRGPKPAPESTKRIDQLEREVARLQRKLENAELIIDVQKKLSQLLRKSGFHSSGSGLPDGQLLSKDLQGENS